MHTAQARQDERRVGTLGGRAMQICGRKCVWGGVRLLVHACVVQVASVREYICKHNYVVVGSTTGGAFDSAFNPTAF